MLAYNLQIEFLIKKKINVPRHQCDESAVDDLGAVVEVGFHSAGAVEAVDGEGRLKDDVFFLDQRAVNVAFANLGKSHHLIYIFTLL